MCLQPSAFRGDQVRVRAATLQSIREFLRAEPCGAEGMVPEKKFGEAFVRLGASVRLGRNTF